MRLICLNVWGGVLFEPLAEFLKESDADIFCFQEILSGKSGMNFTEKFRPNFLQELKELLPEFECYFNEAVDNFGHAIFVKKNLNVKDFGSEIIVEGKVPCKTPASDLPRILQYCNVNGCWIFNFHGFAVWPKVDTPERIEQSKKLLEILRRFKGKKILCGDFNVWQDTESVAMVEKCMRNMIRELGIDTTRNREFSPDDKISDYVFVSHGVNVKSFAVPDIAVSDHLPLILEFE